jgi:hypothetical protein
MTEQRLLTWPPRGLVPAGDGGRLGSVNIPVVLRVLGRRHTLRQRDRWTREQLQAHQARALRQLRDHAYAHGIPATLGGVDEGYPLAITLIGRDGRRVNVEIDEFPDGDPRGRAQRQARTRDHHLMELGWTVVRVPAWRAYLHSEEVADQVLAAAVVNVRR